MGFVLYHVPENNIVIGHNDYRNFRIFRILHVKIVGIIKAENQQWNRMFCFLKSRYYNLWEYKDF